MDDLSFCQSALSSYEHHITTIGLPCAASPSPSLSATCTGDCKRLIPSEIQVSALKNTFNGILWLQSCFHLCLFNVKAGLNAIIEITMFNLVVYSLK